MVKLNVKSFAEYCKVMRKHHDYSLRDLQEHVGISHATLSRVESGEKPDLETFMTICVWYGIRMEAFIL